MSYSELLLGITYVCGYLVIGLGGLLLILLLLGAISFVVNKIYKHMNVSYQFVTFVRKRKLIEQYIKENE